MSDKTQSVYVTNAGSMRSDSGWVSRVFVAIVISSAIGTAGTKIAASIDKLTQATQENTAAVEKARPVNAAPYQAPTL